MDPASADDEVGVEATPTHGKEAVLATQPFAQEASKERGVEGVAAAPAADRLLKIDEETDGLSEAESERLHRAVAQSLRLATRARPDALLPIALLCSRVSDPTVEGLERLRRVARRLGGASELGARLGERDAEAGLAARADASYAVHKGCESRGGAATEAQLASSARRPPSQA